MYGKLIDGKLVYAPDNYVDADGNLTLNFNKNVTKMIEEGYKEITENIPAYDSLTHKLAVKEYIEGDNAISVIYKTITKDLTTEEQLEVISNRISKLSDVMDFLLFNLH